MLQAERKGASATEYGLVFGVFELVVFIISPFYGQHVSTTGACAQPRNVGPTTATSPAFLFLAFPLFLFHLPSLLPASST
jgi:hypothetical protein